MQDYIHKLTPKVLRGRFITYYSNNNNNNDNDNDNINDNDHDHDNNNNNNNSNNNNNNNFINVSGKIAISH